MQVVIYCPGMPFNGAAIEEGHSLGGSESAAFYLARELAAREHQVTVFTTIPSEQAGSWEGVRYLSAGPPSEAAPLGADFEWYAAGTPHDLLIVQRVPDAFRRTFAAKVNLWWCHDLGLKRHQPRVAAQLWNVDRVLAVSGFHREQLAAVYGLPPALVDVIPNAIDPALFGEPQPPGGPEHEAEMARKAASGVLTYTSRPERGLENLVGQGGLMERLLKSAPALTLKVAGYDNTAPELGAYYDFLWRRCRDLPNVELLGPLGKKELADLMRSAWLHVYPTAFEEVSCISVMEAQAGGTPVLATRLAALPETLHAGGALWVEPDAAGPAAAFETEILALRDDPRRWGELHRKALAKAESYRWGPSAEKVLALAGQVLCNRSRSPARLGHHLLHTSDIVAARHLLQKGFPGSAGTRELAFLKKELADHYGFVATGDYEGHNEAFAQWQVEQGIDQGHADPDRLLAMPRLRIVAELVADLPDGARVLDYACGQGHFTAALARRFPNLTFTGVDIAPASIGEGRRRLGAQPPPNLELQAGEAGGLAGGYDLVLACEVLEHVPEPWALADRLAGLLTPNGRFCATVPYGPWEADSYLKIPFRAHIHHLERADLLEMFGHKPGYQVLAVPHGPNRRGEMLGTWRLVFSPGGDAARPMDLDRKISTQAPPETLSVCMVCRDDGLSLARTLESVRALAHQIVIGIDGPAEREGPAWEIGARFGAECFAIEPPTEIGFDEARNQTLDRATGDWVLWIDDDEVLEWPHRLVKYLRPNAFDAYAVKQHHYAVEPEGVIKTDYPCRLFRRAAGFRFFGLVHEHPEKALNEGAGNVFPLPDVAICHHGYETEEVRRERFRRNLPLMVRDRQTYPGRLLGKFLWIRDLAHLNRYALERGEGFSPRLRAQAQEAVRLWRELLAHGQLRMALDALPYYSESVQVLQGGGIAFEVAMGAACGGLGDLNGAAPRPVRGHFLNTADIRLLTETLVREKTTLFEERYF